MNVGKGYIPTLVWNSNSIAEIMLEKKFKNNFSLVVTCRLLKAFTNSLEPDQARQIVGPDPDQNCVTLIVLLTECWRKSLKIIPSADSLCGKQFGPRSGPTRCRA